MTEKETQDVGAVIVDGPEDPERAAASQYTIFEKQMKTYQLICCRFEESPKQRWFPLRSTSWEVEREKAIVSQKLDCNGESFNVTWGNKQQYLGAQYILNSGSYRFQSKAITEQNKLR